MVVAVTRTLGFSFRLTSLLPLGAIPGSVAGTFLCQAMGRRFTLLVSALAYMAGYSVIFAANSSLFFLAGRFMTGVATGIVSLCVPAYVTEVALPRHRGTLVDNECQAIDQLFAILPTPASNFLLAVHVYLLQQLSGISMVILNAHSVFSAPGVFVSASTTFVIIASLQVTVTMCTVSIMAVVGRRRLLTISSVVCVLAMFAFGAFHNAKATGDSLSQRLPNVFLGVFIIGYSVGLGPVVWTLGAELVPCRESGVFLGAATALNWTCALVVTCVSHALVETRLFSALAWFFSLTTLVGTLLTSVFLPETRGQTLEQILIGPLYEPHEEQVSRHLQSGRKL
ncbi:hypothetical protein HPB49_009758 [Dermacentor silvarum]|uniref:Uncharacterized protein n=1 Tax=Dermacentor silvarum TaxID=543639 RepID=A0ACB8DZ21_DERSI|nr:hypothetical protein HPB49_009758 [Dermacentor silvarum]